MAAITGLDSLVSKMTGGSDGNPESMFVWKYFKTASAVLSMSSLGRLSHWTLLGIPGAGVAPGAVEAPTKATIGAIPFTNPGGGREKFIVAAAQGYWPLGIGNTVLYDRLLHIGGLSGTVTTAQTVGGTLTRNTGGVGNMIFAEIYTAVGTTTVNITASYTNEDGTSGRTTGEALIGASDPSQNNGVNQFITLPLQNGDLGVQSVQSVTLSATTGTAGNFGVTVGRPLLVTAPSNANPVGSTGLFLPGVAEIDTDACLATYGEISSTQTGPLLMMISTIEA